jgi:hypothetical protein
MSLSDTEVYYSSSTDDEESEYFQAEDEYGDFDEVCELRSALLEYAKSNSLNLCENLTVDKLYKFLNS